MGKFSVVIVCKNEVAIIGRTLAAVLPISNDVLVYDTGSSDGTVELAEKLGARVLMAQWQGYGKTKQMAVSLAQHEWVLSIDADEVPDDKLQQALMSLTLDNTNVAYQVWFKNFFGDAYLKWGEWGRDRHVRLFNRNVINWNDAAIHESLLLPAGIQVKTLAGHIQHYTASDLQEYSAKTVKYAMLIAEKYHMQAKHAGFVKLYLSPAFTFLKHYVFQLGFLDGWRGLLTARMTAFYTFLKYARLRELNRSAGKKG